MEKEVIDCSGYDTEPDYEYNVYDDDIKEEEADDYVRDVVGRVMIYGGIGAKKMRINDDKLFEKFNDY